MFDYASKIQGLIAKSESAQELGNDAEAAAYRAKAEQLMQQYRIAEEDLIAQDQFSAVPVLDTVVVMESGALTNDLKHYYWQLFSRIAHHAGIRLTGRYSYTEANGSRYGDSRLEATVVGYEGDIAYAKFIWTAARLVFFTRIDARVNRSLSDQVNAYYMRNSGMPRNEIAKALWGSDSKDGAAHGRVQKLYMAECAARGETPRVSGRGIQVKVYREASAREFVSEFGWRLSEAKDATGTSGGGLELHGRKERVDEAFYKEFPDQRPMNEEERKAWEAQQEEARKEAENCTACAKAKTKCRRHRPSVVTAADRRAYDRMYTSPEARAGAASGRAAADGVNLTRGFDRQASAETAQRGAIGG